MTRVVAPGGFVLFLVTPLIVAYWAARFALSLLVVTGYLALVLVAVALLAVWVCLVVAAMVAGSVYRLIRFGTF